MLHLRSKPIWPLVRALPRESFSTGCHLGRGSLSILLAKFLSSFCNARSQTGQSHRAVSLRIHSVELLCYLSVCQYACMYV